MNFWGYMLVGVTNVFSWAIGSFPLAQENVVMAAVPDIVETTIVAPVFWATPVLDLSVAGIIIGLIFVLEAIRAVIAVVRWIYSLIPTAT